MKLSKIEISRIQIERAIDLFVKESDYVSTLTLAGAAEEILGVLLANRGEPNILDELHPWFQERYETDIKRYDFRKNANFTRNELKHANESPEQETEVNTALAAQMLQRAMVNYSRLVGEPTAKMIYFASWLGKNEAAIYEPFDNEELNN